MAVAVMQGTNRFARIALHSRGEGYQTTQLHTVLREIKYIGAAHREPVHLPSASHDLALIDLSRTHGSIAGSASLGLQTGLFVVLCSCAIYGGTTHRRPRAAVAAFFFFGTLGHAAVNLGLLPPTGIPPPFGAAGGSAVAVYSVLLGVVLCPHEDKGIAQDRAVALIVVAKWLGVFVLLAAASTVLSIPLLAPLLD